MGTILGSLLGGVAGRLDHIPEADAPAVAGYAHDLAAEAAKQAGVDHATPVMWLRAVEAAQIAYVEGRIERQVVGG